jgi:cation diffusion facilitator CzcD-associated flavoprotein CzcO
MNGSTKRALSVAIVGAGLGGVAAGVNLKRAGVERITIFEQSAGPGGTWWDNTYPGAECDIPIIAYQYSFKKDDWTRTHASSQEIQAYVQRVIDEFGLGACMRYNTRVVSAVWNDQEHYYTVTTAGGESERFDVVVSALGLLNVPRYPDWPGLETFQGIKFHTARWEHEHDLRGKRVAVVGTGSTAAQVVPALAPVASQLTMFSREPAYVLPKYEHELTEEELHKLNRPFGKWLARAQIFWNLELNQPIRNPKSRQQRAARQRYAKYRDEQFADHPDLKEYWTPSYPYSCKRPVMSTDLFPALKRDNVKLVPRAVASVTENGVVDVDGVEHPCDVLVMATGFQPWNFLKTLSVVGRDGRSIHGVWGDRPEAFLGMQVSGFPNFFIMYGPNTNFYNVTFMLERQAEYVTRCVKKLLRKRATSIEVRWTVMNWYNRMLDRSLSGKVLEANCSNYYHTAAGRNVVTYPWRFGVYAGMGRLVTLWNIVKRAADEPIRHHRPKERTHLSPQAPLSSRAESRDNAAEALA